MCSAFKFDQKKKKKKIMKKKKNRKKKKKKKKKKWLTRKTFAKKVKKMVKVQVSTISLNQKRSNIYNWSIENEMKCWK